MNITKNTCLSVLFVEDAFFNDTSDYCCSFGTEGHTTFETLSHFLPALWIIGFVYTLFTKNVCSSLVVFLPFWLMGWSHPIRTYGFTKHHIVSEFFFHVWSSYALGVLIGITTSLSFKLPCLFYDRFFDVELQIKKKINLDPFRKSFNHNNDNIETGYDDNNNVDYDNNYKNLHGLMRTTYQYKKSILKNFQLEPALYLISLLCGLFGIKLMMLFYSKTELDKCFAFLDDEQSRIWSGVFISFSLILFIGLLCWSFLWQQCPHLLRSNVKYLISLISFVLIHLFFIILVEEKWNVWFGFFYLGLLTIWCVFTWLWIGYIASGLIFELSTENEKHNDKDNEKWMGTLNQFVGNRLWWKTKPTESLNISSRNIAKINKFNTNINSSAMRNNRHCRNFVKYKKHYDGFHNKNDYEKYERCKKTDIYFYKSFLSPYFYNIESDGFYNKDNADKYYNKWVSHDRIKDRKTANWMIWTIYLICFSTFTLAWIVVGITEDSDYILVTLFCISLFYLIFIPLLSVCLKK